MRIHRIHADQVLEPEVEISLKGHTAHYLTRVLRVVQGQTLVLFNGDGYDYAADILRPGKSELLVQILSRLPARAESPLNITVVQAISRGERMDLTLQKCTELGASVFQPLHTERVEVRIRPDKLSKRMDHWRQVVISACEQSGRAVVPPVLQPLKLHEWLDQQTPAQRLVLAPGAQQPLAHITAGNQIEILIGPEGGFSEAELNLADRRGVRPVSLGPRILRTETAGPTAVSVLQAVFGDFS